MGTSPEQVEAVSGPRFACDLILKGGITSGIVYPPAIVEIAKDHRFHSIGGSSAGAIGAAAAAAAELGRGSRTGGFELLATLPTRLTEVDGSGRTKLQRLFQPQRATAPLFDLAWDARGARDSKVKRRLLRTLAGWGSVPRKVLVVAVGAVLLALGLLGLGVVLGGPATLLTSAPLLVVSCIGAAAAVWAGRRYDAVKRLVGHVPAALAGNLFGLCSGMPTEGGSEEAVTDWLYERFQELAGRNDPDVPDELRSRPVTYGELAAAGIRLVTTTTNLSTGAPETFPFSRGGVAFDPAELRLLFPEEVVAFLEAVSTPVEAPADAVAGTSGPSGLRRLPGSDDLPIILGVRLSLSFPILLSAVPLHVRVPPPRGENGTGVIHRRCWFSDAGITSNMPVHLFDAPLPHHPTYAINLTGGGDPSAAPHANVWRPIDARQGIWPRVAPVDDLGTFIRQIIDTAQNWSDNALIRAPGQRDRVCSIRLAAGEGGMNLDMPPDVIRSLVERGAAAGRNLAWIQRGDLAGWQPDDAADRDVFSHQWDRHRFTRLRAALGGLSRYLQELGDGLDAQQTTADYRDLMRQAVDTGWYPYRWSERQRASVNEAIQAILGQDLVALEKGAPTPFTLSPSPHVRGSARAPITTQRHIESETAS